MTEVAVMQDHEVTQESILRMRELPPSVLAQLYNARIKELEMEHRRAFLETGIICSEMSNLRLYRELVSAETTQPFHSFGAWMVEVLGVSRSSAYEAMEAVKLLEWIPIDDLRIVPRCNLATLAKVSTNLLPAVLEAAQTMSEKGFVKMLSERHPDQHIEHAHPVTLKLTTTALGVMDDACHVSEWAYEVKGRGAALEAIFANFLNSPCEREGFSGMTNWNAFQTKKEMA